MRLAVAGATGGVGKHVADVARERGHEVVELTRAAGVDLTTGSGLAGRLDGVAAVVDTTNVMTQKRSEAEAFFGSVTRQLLAAEKIAGVGHHLALSIVGIDGSASGYYAGKRLQERLLADGDVPWTVLRATQFHEFAEQMLGFASLGRLSVVPVMQSQPVAAREVGEALIDLVEAGPAGRAPDLAGPEVLRMDRAARQVNRARNLGRWIVPVRVPGAAGAEMRSGKLLPSDAGPRGQMTFEEWLGVTAR
ncbi:MAG: SDR family oxidoreductase [Nocardioides sp.]